MDIVYIALAAALVAAVWGLATGCGHLQAPLGDRS